MRMVLSVSAATFALVSAAAGLEPGSALQEATPAPRPQCCYTNPRYAGVCAVEAERSETCASIRAYLNNPQSQGNTYCVSTSVRGGWKQVKCATTRGK